MREGVGLKPRLTEQERSRILALVKQPPPGRLERYADGTLDAREEEGSAQWSLDALTEAAHAAGIQVERSQIRRIYLCEGVRWRHTHSWGESSDKDACPERTAVVTHYAEPPDGSTTICTDELGLVLPRTFAPAPGWSPDGHRVKAPLEYSRGDDKVWIYGADAGYVVARRSRDALLRAIPEITSSYSKTSKQAIQRAISSLSQTT